MDQEVGEGVRKEEPRFSLFLPSPWMSSDPMSSFSIVIWEKNQRYGFFPSLLQVGSDL